MNGSKDQHTSSVKALLELAYEDTNKCVQCGYCLPVCPTYESMGKETASPRGRINLVKMAAQGKIDIQTHLQQPIDLCLGCRACEVACPVGVPYGRILETAKEVIAKTKAEQSSETKADKWKHIILKRVFPYPKRLRAIGNLVFLYQKFGVDKLVRKTKILQHISEPLSQFEKVLPNLEEPSKRTKWGVVYPAKGEKKASVAFFAGCVTDALLYRTNRLAIQLLNEIGCEVVIPESQNCCGALHAHQGSVDGAKELAKKNIDAFEQSGADYYVNHAGGCGAILREYDQLFKDDESWRQRALDFAHKSKDISEILVELGPLPFRKNWEGIITYQDSCHLRNVQGVYRQPRQLLQSIPGATYVELEGSDSCCASGGIYNMIHFHESMKILDQKMGHVKDTQAAIVATANPGCLLQMRLGVEREGLSKQVRAVHIVEVLAEACGLQ